MPGGLTTLFVRGLQNIEGTRVVESYPAGPELAGIRVNIYGRTAPVLLVSQLAGYQQINVQVSWVADVSVRPMIEVKQGGESAVVQEVPPGVFDAIYTDESGYAVAFHASDWSRISATSPARKGEWILFFASNLGKIDQAIEDGALSPETGMPLAFLNTNRDRLDYGLVNANSEGRNSYNPGGLLSCSESLAACGPPTLATGLLGLFFFRVYVYSTYAIPDTDRYGLILQRRLCSSDRFPCPDRQVISSRVALLHVAEPE